MTGRQMAEAERLWSEGATIAYIAERIGVGVGSLVDTIQRNRDFFPMRKAHADTWAERLALVEGMRSGRAARLLGVSRHTVWKWRKKLDRS